MGERRRGREGKEGRGRRERVGKTRRVRERELKCNGRRGWRKGMGKWR